MIRPRSIEAYRDIKKSGLLAGRRWQVYEYVFKHGPCTMNEAWRSISKDSAMDGIKPRFTELTQMGVLEVVGERRDKQTKMLNDLYDITNNLPNKLKKPKRVLIEANVLLADIHLKMADMGMSYLHRKEIEDWIAERYKVE